MLSSQHPYFELRASPSGLLIMLLLVPEAALALPLLVADPVDVRDQLAVLAQVALHTNRR